MRSFAVASFALAASLLVPGLASAKKLTVVSTTTAPAAIVEEIGGDGVRVLSLCKGYQDPHFLDAKPSYMVEMHSADLVVAIGLDLEIGYLPTLVSGSRNPKIQGGNGFLDLSTVIEPKDVVGIPDRRAGDVHPTGNPHYWLDPENGRLIARAIAERLAALDPGGKATYQANLAAWEKTLDEKQADWAKRMEPLKGQKIATFHKSWTYFVDRYGLQVIGYVEPKPGIPPTPSHTLELIRKMQSEKAKFIIMENFYDRRAPDVIAKNTGAKVVYVPNNVGGEESVKTYFDLIEKIVSTFEQQMKA